jgi:hypothetical protein
VSAPAERSEGSPKGVSARERREADSKRNDSSRQCKEAEE